MTINGKTRLPPSDMAHIALFTTVIAVCSWISIPFTVPFTMQTFGVFLAAGVLGGKRGTLAVAVYLLLGLVGAPVFSGFSAGIGRLMGSTGGYILGFLFSALVMWAMEALLGKQKWVLAVSMVLGLLVCYVFGTAWFMIVYGRTTGTIGLWSALSWCVFPYLLPDIIKIALALPLCARLQKMRRHTGLP